MLRHELGPSFHSDMLSLFRTALLQFWGPIKVQFQVIWPRKGMNPFKGYFTPPPVFSGQSTAWEMGVGYIFLAPSSEQPRRGFLGHYNCLEAEGECGMLCFFGSGERGNRAVARTSLACLPKMIPGITQDLSFLGRRWEGTGASGAKEARRSFFSGLTSREGVHFRGTHARRVVLLWARHRTCVALVILVPVQAAIRCLGRQTAVS